jgi:hypothetical protein
MNHKKIFYYNIFLYLSIFLIETLTLAAQQLNKFAQGKVLSSLVDYSFDVIGLDLIRYTLTIACIYLACAYANSLIIHYLVGKRLFDSSRRPGQNMALCLFVIYNGLFIFVIFSFNQLVYPLSIQGPWSFLEVLHITPNVSQALFWVFGVFYSLLVMVAVEGRKKKIGVLFVVLLTCIGVYNHLPHFLANNPRSFVATSNKRKPPVIILGVDSLRTDQLTMFGAPERVLPHVEQFLEQSIVFKDAHTPLARTFPSWISILTGNYPVNSGARYNLIKRNRLQERTPFLGTALQGLGYKTLFAIDETRFCNMMTDDGFDAIISPPPGMVDFVLGNFHDFTLANLFFNNRFGHLFFPFAENNRAIPHLYTGTHFVDDVLLNLDNTHDENSIFLAMHLCAAHWPYKISGNASGFNQSPRDASEQTTTTDYFDYSQSLQIADAQLGRILEGLKQRNLYDQALIVVLSDHGESFGDGDS